ncbi:formimidoylglutamase [Chromobacterium subtsugae]|uniref:Formimidoylglutamase n=1 Tax=Chromobacterium subtsugae TaxID=251747 RepID=A0ABS7FJA9_9NEIS|nr:MULTISPECIES: formimidoylglutamase [Chromobacterium]KUM02254.1 formimidoylglutamase [Chromobacterium subtsugae]KZE86209.1 formimidoylglutamase [Chromobacterium sp. F49]MBW7568056.1 formimidoylglutamase [Chromobacterium subtsugae]MBW8289570.1 formimidoylglutamase [Chromobacterium subtsugae]OBU86258.1 formimidoylglutamase [Chromobacterium subtsugae]
MSIDMSGWTGRIDKGEGDGARRWHQLVQPLAEGAAPGVAIIGFACDEGVRRNQGRVGAANGPRALRKALANLAYHPTLPLYDAGDVVCDAGNLDAAQRKLALKVQQAAEAGHLPLVLGGGHETAYGHWLGLADAHPGKRIGIVNFDAHFDLRHADEATSGTPFAQIAADCARRGQHFRYLCLGVAETANTQALFDTARALGAEWRLDTEMTGWQLADIRGQLAEFLDSVDAVYLTIDLDVLPAAQMPAVSAPAGYGVDIAVVETLVGRLAKSGKLIGADLVEFNPEYDIDSHGAKAAARLAWSLTRHLRR